MSSKILALLVFVVAVQCDLTAEQFASMPWSQKFDFIKGKISENLNAVPEDQKNAALDQGINYLTRGGEKPVGLSELGERLLSLLNDQQKHEVAAYLRTLKQ